MLDESFDSFLPSLLQFHDAAHLEDFIFPNKDLLQGNLLFLWALIKTATNDHAKVFERVAIKIQVYLKPFR